MKKIFLSAVILPCIAFAAVAMFAFKPVNNTAAPERVAAALITERNCYDSESQRNSAYSTSLNQTHYYHLVMNNDSYEEVIPYGPHPIQYCYVIEYYA